MKQKLKKKWLTALRDGSYTKTTGLLNNGQGSFCALGVLHDIAGGDWQVETEEDGYAYTMALLPDGSTSQEDLFYMDGAPLYGLTRAQHNSVSNLNDDMANVHSFGLIAKWIEENVPGEPG